MACLFDSLSVFLLTQHRKQPSSDELRQQICNYLESNNQIMDDLNTDDVTRITSNLNIKQYVDNMRKHSTWGSALEIKAFCEIYKVNVTVVHLQDKRHIEFLPSQKNKEKPTHTIFLNYTGNHYTPSMIKNNIDLK